MKGWLKKYDDNPNDSSVSLPPNFNGMSNDTQGRDYSPAWGGQFQNGGEMKYYQEGLDFRPKGMRSGGVIKDDRGQWDHPGEITEIGSNQITMQGVPYPVLGISNTGDQQMMYPGQDYQYKGSKVTEYPMAQDGKELQKLDQLTNFTNYNKPQPGGWLNKYSR